MNVHFDVGTLLFATALTTTVCAGARFLLWRMHPGIAGLYHWAMAGIAGALALVFLLSYEYDRWAGLVTIAQLLIMTSLLLSLFGFRRFLKYPPLPRPLLAAVTAVFIAWLVFAHIAQSIFVRALVNAILVAIVSGLIARVLLSSKQPGHAAIRATGWLFVLNAIIFSVRAFLPHIEVTGPHDPLNPAGVTAYVLLWWLSLSIAVTLGMFLMTAERLQAELDSQASIDPLTGALNRRAFALIAEKFIARARRYTTPLSVLIMDLDDFKLINDQHGHETGDLMLCHFVDIAKRILRSEDVFCRFGGEEFVAMLPDTTGQQAYTAAERLRETFLQDSAMPGSTAEIVSSITVSIGIAELAPGENIDDMLRRADSALYQAKHSGRNRCEFATVQIDQLGDNNKLSQQGITS